MAIVKREKLTWFQRIRRLILGKEKPNRVTRISVSVGFFIWVILVSWHVMTLMVLTLMGTLKNGDKIKAAFLKLGSSLYDIPNIINRLWIFTIAELVLFGVALIALILIYRKKRIGFLLYIIATPLTVLIVIPSFGGFKYFQHELGYWDLILPGITTLYFGIGALWFYKIKPPKKKEEPENSYAV